MSDMSAGQIVGGIVGAVVGFFGGGYNPATAAQGFVIGAGIGGVIDPQEGPKIKAPPDNQLEFQTSTYGIEKPDFYGSPIVSGNIIYFENGKLKRVVTEEESGGKGGGGGSTVEVVDYYGTWAVALGNARPGAKLRRLWLGNRLFYDATATPDLAPYYSSGAIMGAVIQATKNSNKFAFYDGTQTTPNARIASIVGAANAESYEGTMYLMMYDVHMADYGNSLTGAALRAEIVCVPEIDPQIIESNSISTSPGNTFDPVIHKLTINSSAAMLANWTNSYPEESSYEQYYQSFVGFPYQSKITVSDGTWIPQTGLNIDFGGETNLENLWPDLVGIANLRYSSGGYQKRNGHLVGYYIDNLYRQTLSGLRSITPSLQPLAVCVSSSGIMYSIDSAQIHIWDDDLNSPLLSVNHGISGGHFVSGFVRMWHDTGLLYVGHGELTSQQLSRFNVFNALTLDLDDSFTIDPALVGFGYAEFAIEQGVLLRGYYSTIDDNLTFEKWQLYSVVIGAEQLSDVVESIVERANISAADIDTSELVDTVDGFAATGGTRGALGVLQAAFLFDIIEDGYGLTCVNRGGAASETIPYQDLGAVDIGGDSSNQLLIDREMDQQLPRKMTITFKDQDREQNKGTAESTYPVQSAVEEVVDFPLAMTQEKANKIVDILMRARHTERMSMSFTLPQEYLHLKPSDVVNIETPDRTYQVRIASRAESSSQVLSISGKLSAPSLWTSDAVAGENNYIPPGLDLVSDATAVLLDVPMILDEQDTASFLMAMYGVGSWPGGSLLRSTDSGQTYSATTGLAANSTSGVAVDILPADDGFVINRTDELNIVTLSGEFTSVTEAQMMTGQNFVAYGDDGRWELMRYIDAAANADGTVTLSGLLRGLRDTVQYTGTHEAGDRIIKISGNSAALVGANIQRLGVQSLYKAVTFGQEIDDAEPFPFTYRGVNFRPYAPIFPEGELDGDDWIFGAQERTRYPASWWSTGIQPISESILSFEAEILDGPGGGVKRILTADTISSPNFSFVYPELDQISDFGVVQNTIYVNIYQISSIIGRGNVLESSFTLPGTDKYFNNVSLLLHFDGDFSDSSNSANVLTANGNVTTSATGALYVQSGSFDGAGDFLTIPRANSLTISENQLFTLECWIKVLEPGRIQSIYNDRPTVSSRGMALVVSSTGELALVCFTNTGTVAVNISSSSLVDDGLGHRVAITRNNDDVYLFVDGNLEAFSSGGSSIGSSTNNIYIGRDPTNTGRDLNGLIDELRVTAGICRYTDDYTYPNQPFPDL
ncbi:hypothetical protein G8770_03510 [Aestuariicella hydrocarbonica]|uniref:Tip attachment protein J domain-containing protein n=1 Tax=Pseudomaricurvus hydrocarbonicus TaxID=1470433 RepID=A0A9E5MJX9_9GAMM|nr:phage tail protein [Aestuariicella hydrocarbonica]NHO64612.1 hypothetical protein [Aestuariicella hydrocarbonica]